MVTPLITRTPTVKITYGAYALDFSDSVIAVDVTSEAETVDIGTFTYPKANDVGRTTEAVTMAVLWSDALYSSASAYVGTEGTFKLTPNGSDSTAYIQGTVKIGALPYGRFETGQRVESDIVLAVTGAGLTYYT
jgi:hypothetical protein